VELEKIDYNISIAQKNQVDIISPKNFRKAINARNDAVSLRSQNKDQKKILHKIALSQAYIDKSNEVARNSNELIGEALNARSYALSAGAMGSNPNEFIVDDERFMSLTNKIEDNDTSDVEKQSPDIVSAYQVLELKAIKKNKLSYAQGAIDQAIKEGAEKLTPETLEMTQKNFSANEKTIEANRRDQSVINVASANADKAALRLLRMVRNAKISTVANPEAQAKQIEENTAEALASEQALRASSQNLNESNARLAFSNRQNSKLDAEVKLNRQYDEVRSQFTNEEADVYKQGPNLLLRLKGLSFDNNKSDLTSKNYSLLTKVQKVMGNIDFDHVSVEGHTDSLSGKQQNADLSMRRAESVKSYLIANNNITQNRISAIGLGDTKPLATNKTVLGRSQNRRVDVILSP
jgi:OmpA-OmpF porin, OOP family